MPTLRHQPLPSCEPQAMSVMPYLRHLTDYDQEELPLPLTTHEVPDRAQHHHAIVHHTHDGATSPDDPNGPLPWMRHFAQAAIEVHHGLRPALHLTAWANHTIVMWLARQGREARKEAALQGLRQQRTRIRVMSTRYSSPQPTALEVCCVVHDRFRALALAFRVERHHGRWQVVHLDIIR